MRGSWVGLKCRWSVSEVNRGDVVDLDAPREGPNIGTDLFVGRGRVCAAQ